MLQYDVVPRGEVMEKFNRTLRGYDPEEVNAFLDQVIEQVEIMIEEIKQKNERIRSLEALEQENNHLKEQIEQHKHLEGSLNRAILMAQRTSDQIKVSAHHESEIIMEEAKKNASRIVNEALLRADKIEEEANMLRRNVTVFKRKLKDIIEAQLDMVNDIDKVDF